MKRCAQLFLTVFLTTLAALPIKAQLVPGDLAITRIQSDAIAIMALADIAESEVIYVTNSFWIDGSFDGSGGTGTIPLPSGGLRPGEQLVVDLSKLGINIEWRDTLHLYQQTTPPFSDRSYVKHLILVEMSVAGLRWWTNIPDGLTEDITHIVIKENADNPGVIDHVMKEVLLSQSLTPFRWLNALGSFRAWTYPETYSKPLTMAEWGEMAPLTVESHPGMISLPFDAQSYNEADGQAFIPVRRSFGSSGSASVDVKVSKQIESFEKWQNQTISGINMDLTGVAYGPGVGFVAVAPTNGTILIYDGSDWGTFPTNDDDRVNLELSGIIHDGSAFWACSMDGRIYKSEDGRNWGHIYTHDVADSRLFRIFHFPAASFPYLAIGRDGLCLYSSDGSDWRSSAVGGDANLFGAAYFADEYVLSGAGGVIIYSSDPSANEWSLSSTPTSQLIFSLTPVTTKDGSYLFAAGRNGAMLSTLSPKNGFIKIESNTGRDLFDIRQLTIGEDSFVLAIGANGITAISKNAAAFETSRLSERAPALYALEVLEADKDPVVIAVGEYGSLVRFDPASSSLSGSLDGITLDEKAQEISLSWEAGVAGDQYVKLVKGVPISAFGERIDLKIEKPTSGENDYYLGEDKTEISFFRSTNGQTIIAENFGPLIGVDSPTLKVRSSDEWGLSFSLVNTSDIASKRLFIRFEGTNLPDYTIPNAATSYPGSQLGPLEQTDLIEISLRQPVETMSLYEEFRSGEEVLKANIAINSLVASTTWVPNGFLPRSLGVYLDDNGNLDDPGIPGIDTETDDDNDSGGNLTKSISAKSGFVFSGSAPTPPANLPNSSELLLIGIDVQGPTGMDVRSSYEFFLEGSFFNMGTGLINDYTMNTVSWSLTDANSPKLNVSIESDGNFEPTPRPEVEYPKSVTIKASTSEGAPLDDKGNPVTFQDQQSLSITEPSSYRTFGEWVSGETTLAADEDGETQDADNDQIENLIEFALDLDPEVPNPINGVAQSYDSDTGDYTFSFTRPKDLSRVKFYIETTTDLSAEPIVWTQQTMTLDSSTSTTETWSTTVNLGSIGYGRLRVETYTP